MSEKPKNAWHNVYGISSEELQNAKEAVEKRYGDILYAKRPDHTGRKQNPSHNRAAQFLPFAALTGFETEIAVEGRYTEQRVELSSEEMEALEAGLQEVRRTIQTMPEVVLERFEPDPDKAGGCYREIRARIRKIDELHQRLITEDGEAIAFSDLRTLVLPDFQTEW